MKKRIFAVIMVLVLSLGVGTVVFGGNKHPMSIPLCPIEFPLEISAK